jgi:fructose-1,6-bisphosphatase I
MSVIPLLESLGYPAHDAELIGAIAQAGAKVSALLRDGVRRRRSSRHNVHGELVHTLDQLSTELFADALAASPACAGLLAEETREALEFSNTSAERFVFLDPLDGSANLDSHGPTGSIFGIVPWTGSSETSALAPGRTLTAAGYLLYSSATLLVLATRTRVDLLAFDPELGQFVLRQAALTTPRRGSVYSVNEANVGRWRARDREFLALLKSGEALPGRAYSQRYAGALVADAHRALIQGGFFAYPADLSAPKGKLRLQYEVNPMAFVLRAAGGRATTGTENPLDVVPESGHERSPLILGSCEELERYERWLSETAHPSVRPPSLD